MNEHYLQIQNTYAQWLMNLGFSNSIIKNYADRIRDFFEWLSRNGIYRINSIQAHQIQNYFQYLECHRSKSTQKLLSTSHLNHHFCAVDKLLEFLHQLDMNQLPIPTNYRIRADHNARIEKMDILTTDEVKTLISHIHDEQLYQYNYYSKAKQEQVIYQYQLLFALFYACGLRRMEGFNLRARDIDFNKKTIFIHQGKNYQDRIIPLNDNTAKTLQDYIYNFRHLYKCDHQRLFIVTHGHIEVMLKRLQAVVKDPVLRSKKITLHTLRHSIATHLLQNGMKIENISLFLGHNSLESTQVYTHFIEGN
jgi:integrase/recombinase XerD